jgi:hypothetical protein
VSHQTWRRHSCLPRPDSSGRPSRVHVGSPNFHDFRSSETRLDLLGIQAKLEPDRQSQDTCLQNRRGPQRLSLLNQQLKLHPPRRTVRYDHSAKTRVGSADSARRAAWSLPNPRTNSSSELSKCSMSTRSGSPKTALGLSTVSPRPNVENSWTGRPQFKNYAGGVTSAAIKANANVPAYSGRPPNHSNTTLPASHLRDSAIPLANTPPPPV